MTEQQRNLTHDQFIEKLKGAESQLEETLHLVALQCEIAGEKVRERLEKAIMPLGETGVFPTIKALERIRGLHAPDAILYGQTNQPGLLLDQNLETSVYLSPQGIIFRAKTYTHPNEQLSVDTESEMEEIDPEEYLLYAPKAIEVVSSFIKEYFLAGTQ